MPDLLDFDDARAAVRARFEPSWTGPGTFAVATSGYADALDFLVDWGARDWIVDGDPAFMSVSGTQTFVDRRTGDVRQESAIEMFDKVDRMRPVTATP